MTPKQLFLTKGMGRHKAKPVSFELALRDAGIAQYNLVEVTSIFPPGCEIVQVKDGLKCLSPGEIVYCVMSRIDTDKPNQLIAASMGLAIPKETDKYGYLLEHQSLGENAEDAGRYAESLAADMLATTLSEDRIARTMNVSQSAKSDGNGVWTTVVAVAVFVPGED